MVVSGTQRKGDIAKSRAIASFTALGLDVSVPITEAAAYDLIVDTGEDLFRVQVKFSKSRDVDLRRIHANSTGYIVKKYRGVDFDWLYVLTPEGLEYLITAVLANISRGEGRPDQTKVSEKEIIYDGIVRSFTLEKK